MRLAILFSGGKDSTYAAFLARKYGHEVACLITLDSENKDSFMFHTPSIRSTATQAKAMGIPLLEQTTKGVKEEELDDLRDAFMLAQDEFHIEGVVTGAVESVYQAARVQKICNSLGLEVFNPLWQQEQEALLRELVENGFKAIVVGVAAYPLGKEWLGREIDAGVIDELLGLREEYKINPAGEGGEFETLVLDCPLFSSPLTINEQKISGERNSWRLEVKL